MKTVLLFLAAYLLGSIPSGIWIGKLFFNKDIRNYGSGNMGTTNTMRVLGKRAGLVVFALDLLKGTLATLLPQLFHVDINPLWFGVAAVIGHTLPVFAGFSGGKAVATSAGMLLGYNPLFFLYAVAVFFIILFFTSTVSLTSIITAIIVTFSTLIFPKILPLLLPRQDPLLSIICGLLTLYIIYRHRDNLKRIKAGTENRVNFGLSKNGKKS